MKGLQAYGMLLVHSTHWQNMTVPKILATALVASLVCGEAVAESPRAVVELFTSQGCSSCPPADKLIAEIASDPGVLAISFPVDYWDYLGWKDTLADKAFSARQKAYGDTRGDRHVYTPQAVVDGLGHAVGSDRSAVLAAASEGTAHGALTIPVSVEPGPASIKIRLPAAPQPFKGPATVLLLPVLKRTEVAIGRGENKGHTVTYTNVVREVVSLGPWDGTARTFEAPASLAKMRNADTYVVVVQQGTPERPGLILGAAKGPGL